MLKLARLSSLGLVALSSLAFSVLPGRMARAAGHCDAPNEPGDQASDLADVFVFLDPNDNTKLTIVGTFRGFIVPSEAVNFGVFDQTTTYRFDIENTGDPKPDMMIDVSFSAKG